MTRTPLMADQTLFRDSRTFDTTHLPETFNYRDAQIRDLAFALRPTLRGSAPLNTVLRGPPGTGKTTAVRRIFAEVEEATQAVVPVLVSCQVHRTAYAVFGQVYLALFGQVPPGSGVPLRRLMGRIAGELTARGAVLVVCLDDAGYLLPDNVLNDLLAGILRMHEGYPGTRAGVMLVVSDVDVDLVRCLDPATRSVLQASEVYFPLYTPEEIRGILADRIRAGLYPGVVPPAVLDLLVERTHACGDLRVGPEMIRRAALAAEMDARREVEAADVLAAYAASLNLQVERAVRSLDAGERAVLDSIVAAGLEDEEEPVISGRVYERLGDRMQMSYTAFHERLRRLELLRLVDLAVVRRRGLTRVILVREGVEEVLQVPAGSSGVPVNGPAGVCDDEKC
ncbi:orc1/cdc6 family replication initiation protein [Methanofollis liminatans DSM 4140]|uniref:ORC1-type DNA replication protein n=1 Tax=Methanofollis liminatans DSM 4140 TaxID=28892 RepID=J1L0M3_9EURY|nr:ORC1-type DNA replication protein [Methanofollis liminatans]EJG06170.1 orc1/cdc6 family replication initiation protein [Methanofollis liminatans DSM 4140]